MELAALPGHAGQGGAARRLEAGMIVGDDQLDAFQAPPDQAVEEGAPMHLRLGQGDRHAQHPAMTALGDADRHQHRAIDQASALAHPLIAGIQKEVGRFLQGRSRQAARPASSCSAARLTWVDEIDTSGPSSACRTVITLRVETPCTYISAKRDIERLLGARALLQRAGVEAATAHLGHIEGHASG
jgi:hypothetical protein